MNELNSQPEPRGSSLRVEAKALEAIGVLQEELDKLREQLAWSNRLSMLGTLSAALAHEYNNLLTPIGSYAQLALANPDDEELKQKALEAAVRGVARADKLTQATLGFASPNQRDTENRCGIDGVIEEALQSMSPAIQREGICLKRDVEKAEVAIGSQALLQVTMNLINNAINAMRSSSDPKQITITGELTGESYRLEITDNGPGLPPDLIDQIFEPFVTRPSQPQSDDSNMHITSQSGTGVQTSKPTGTGLGLSICKQLIEAAGGQIQAINNAQGGATLRITLNLESPSQT